MSNNISTGNILPFCISLFKDKLSASVSRHNETHNKQIYIVPIHYDRSYIKLVFTRTMTESGVRNITDTNVLDMLINIYVDEIIKYISQVYFSSNDNIEFTFLSMNLPRKKDVFSDNVYMKIIFSINEIL